MRKSWSGNRKLPLLLVILWEHCRELETSGSHDICWWTVQERRVCIFVLNRKWRLKGSPWIPLLKCRENLLLIRAIISVFLGPSGVRRMWFLKFQMSHSVLQSFVISADIHMTPEIFAPSDLR